jgi:hypothetical protein
MPAPDAGVSAETTPAANVPLSAPFPERKRFSFRATAVRAQGVLRGSLSLGAAAGERAASSHQATQFGSFPVFRDANAALGAVAGRFQDR